MILNCIIGKYESTLLCFWHQAAQFSDVLYHWIKYFVKIAVLTFLTDFTFYYFSIKGGSMLSQSRFQMSE